MRTHIKSLSIDRQQKILDDYRKTKSLIKVSRLWNIDHRTIQKFLRRSNVYVEPKKSTELDNANVRELYGDHVPIYKIAKKLGTTHRNVRKKLLELNVNLRGNRWHDYDENYFSVIDSEKKAYWLGFLYADGNVYSDGYKIHSVTIKLSSNDRSHLDRFRDAIGYTGNIKDRSAMSSFPRKEYNKVHSTSQLRITSKKMFDDLIHAGCHCNKSLILSFPKTEHVPEQYINHFIRGYFDGDGCICVSNESCQITFLGTKKFLARVQNILITEVGVGKTKISKKNRIYSIHWGGNLQCQKIGEYLYNNATIWLDRKREKFDNIKKSDKSP